MPEARLLKRRRDGWSPSLKPGGGALLDVCPRTTGGWTGEDIAKDFGRSGVSLDE